MTSLRWKDLDSYSDDIGYTLWFLPQTQSKALILTGEAKKSSFFLFLCQWGKRQKICWVGQWRYVSLLLHQCSRGVCDFICFFISNMNYLMTNIKSHHCTLYIYIQSWPIWQTQNREDKCVPLPKDFKHHLLCVKVIKVAFFSKCLKWK